MLQTASLMRPVCPTLYLYEPSSADAQENTNHRRAHADGAGNGPIRAEVGGDKVIDCRLVRWPKTANGGWILTSCIINYNPWASAPIMLKIYVVSYYVTETWGDLAWKLLESGHIKIRGITSQIFLFLFWFRKGTTICAMIIMNKK